jgi:type II secretory ATPase GspE/PulE/Tfp pilus assembly ATPase PilB-like protein
MVACRFAFLVARTLPVLSRTNPATDAVVRLADMGVEPYLIAASLRGVLVRCLCERCRRPTPERAAEVLDLYRARGLTAPEGTDYHRAVGCPTCGGSGFHGRARRPPRRVLVRG